MPHPYFTGWTEGRRVRKEGADHGGTGAGRAALGPKHVAETDVHATELRYARSVDFPPDAPSSPATPAEKMRACLEMYEEGVELQRLAFKRRYPELDDAEVQALLDRWLARMDEG